MIIDGAIDWGTDGPHPAAPGFDIESRKVSVYEWVRQVRGGVLAGACTIERHLSAAIIHYMLRDRIRVPEIRDAFDEGLLKPLTFERRINVAILVAPNILAEKDVSAFKADLNDLRSLRNAMAHNPFWFHAELNREGQVANLVPMIMRGKTPLPLTTALIEKLNVQIGGLIEKSATMAATAARLGPAVVSELK